MVNAGCKINVRERAGIARFSEPVSAGVPFPKGVLKDVANLALRGPDGKECLFEAKALSLWSDGSVKWALVEMLADCPALGCAKYSLEISHAGSFPGKISSRLLAEEEGDLIKVVTGDNVFLINKRVMAPFISAAFKGKTVISFGEKGVFLAVGEKGAPCSAEVTSAFIESAGPVRATIVMEGLIRGLAARRDLKLRCRFSFFAGRGLVRLECALHNPGRAFHPGGFWDLGDKGSALFRSFGAYFPVLQDAEVSFSETPEYPFKRATRDEITIYQDSSGGERWQSPNHVDRNGKVNCLFKGYRVYSGSEVIGGGTRARPKVRVLSGGAAIICAIPDMWRDFPKSLGYEDGKIFFGLFPELRTGNSCHELQGGEKKTHIFYVNITSPEADSRMPEALSPLVPHCGGKWYAASGVFPYMVLPEEGGALRERFASLAVDEAEGWAAKAELVDEFGWRNNGEIFADHELEHYKGPMPLISHYNNQYDLVYGSALEFARRGDERWRDIMMRLARHVSDIDIYHTKEDKPAYNGGLFWHTRHYAHAGRSTHRCYSRISPGGERSGESGGPSNEHNYTTGLMTAYFMSGDEDLRDAVMELAEWVIKMESGKDPVLGLIDHGDTGLSTQTASINYHGPGRGAANSINAMIDAFQLTGDRKYLSEAEKRIKRCVHPYDDGDALGLSDPETRWSYTVFLQALGKYLDVKEELGESDTMYSYAAESLMSYAFWMLEKEYVYLDKPEKLEYPTLTWAAQELRKTCVLLFAAKHSDGKERVLFREKAEYFYKAGMGRLGRDGGPYPGLRPLAILLSCGTMFDYFSMRPELEGMPHAAICDLAPKKPFTPRKVRIKKKLFWAILIAGAVFAAGVSFFL